MELSKRNYIADQFLLIMKQKLDEEPRTPYFLEFVSLSFEIFPRELKKFENYNLTDKFERGKAGII